MVSLYYKVHSLGNKAYKFRFYPNHEQQAFLAKCFGCSQFIYNYFLRLTTNVYAECKKSLRYKEWAKLLTQWVRKAAIELPLVPVSQEIPEITEIAEHPRGGFLRVRTHQADEL